jgi:hypothetical protein
VILTCAWEKMVVIWKQPGHFTSIKKLLGAWISLFNLCLRLSSLCDGYRRSGKLINWRESDINKDKFIHSYRWMYMYVYMCVCIYIYMNVYKCIEINVKDLIGSLTYKKRWSQIWFHLFIKDVRYLIWEDLISYSLLRNYEYENLIDSNLISRIY